MTPEEAVQLIGHVVEEKQKLEQDIFLKIKDFEEKYNVFVAFIRNVPYIQMDGEERTQDVRLDIKI